MAPEFIPDFSSSCRICGTSPCVVVTDHGQGETELCGRCFFAAEGMEDWENWPEGDDSTPDDLTPDDSDNDF